METISAVFGRRVKNLRTGKKMSQEKLAEASGLHSTYIGQIERGEKSPTLESICKIAAGLNTSLGELFKNMDAAEAEEESYADKIYNAVLSLPPSKQKKIYRIIEDIISL